MEAPGPEAETSQAVGGEWLHTGLLTLGREKPRVPGEGGAPIPRPPLRPLEHEHCTSKPSKLWVLTVCSSACRAPESTGWWAGQRRVGSSAGVGLRARASRGRGLRHSAVQEQLPSWVLKAE